VKPLAAETPGQSFQLEESRSEVTNADDTLQHREASANQPDASKPSIRRHNPSSALPNPIHRVRVLDESAVLPHEVSFATVSLHERTADRSYSPAMELLTKFDVGLKRVFLVLILAVCVAVVIVGLKFNAGGIFESQTGQKNITLSNLPVPQSKSPTSQPQLESAVPVAAAPVLDTPKETANPAGAPATDEQLAVQIEEKQVSRPVGIRRRNNRASDKTSDAARQETPAAPATMHPVESSSSAKPENRAKPTPTAEGAETPTVGTGGSERPRRVKPQSDSPGPAPGASPVKPKVIDWP